MMGIFYLFEIEVALPEQAAGAVEIGAAFLSVEAILNVSSSTSVQVLVIICCTSKRFFVDNIDKIVHTTGTHTLSVAALYILIGYSESGKASMNPENVIATTSTAANEASKS